MNKSVVFKKEQYNQYQILWLSSEDILLNIIGRMFIYQSGTNWLRKQLLDQSCKEIWGDVFYILKKEDDTIIVGDLYERCLEEGCCGPVKEIPISKKQLLNLLDKWDKVELSGAQEIEFSRNDDTFELTITSA